MKKYLLVPLMAALLCSISCSNDNSDTPTTEQPNANQNKLSISWDNNLVNNRDVYWSNGVNYSASIPASQNQMFDTGRTDFIDYATGNYITKIIVQTRLITGKIKVLLNGKQIEKVLDETKHYEITFKLNSGVWQPDAITLIY